MALIGPVERVAEVRIFKHKIVVTCIVGGGGGLIMSVEVGMHVCGRYKPFFILLLEKCVHRGIVD